MVRTNQSKSGLAIFGVIVAVMAMFAALLGAAPSSASSGLVGDELAGETLIGDSLDFSSIEAQSFTASVNSQGNLDIEVLTSATSDVADELRALGATVTGSLDGGAVHVESAAGTHEQNRKHRWR